MQRLFLHRPVVEVMVKPAGADCNLSCDYCYYLNKNGQHIRGRHRMSDSVLEGMIQQLLSQDVPQVSIGWQGGEPTLMGLHFYQKAVDLMERYGRGQSVANGFQTNGLLIDQEWAQFFRKYHFLVGLSFDGPEHVHNYYRQNRSGGGSWQKALDASKLLLDAGVDVNVLTVVTDYSSGFPDEIYEFHKSVGLNFMQFIPCVETEGNRISNFSVDAASYGEFLTRIFDLWLGDFVNGVPRTSIRWFEALLFNYAGLSPTECTLLKKCGNYLLIEHTGDVYTCDFFVEPGWKLGNLLETSLPSLFNSTQQISFGRQKSNLPMSCKKCEWRPHCLGGCTKDRWRDSSLNGHNYFCEAYQRFFAHADSRLQQLAKDWKRKQNETIY